ncbi:MAG: hypothetical protein IJ715_05220 [Bacilli bacterium]|nr:hypothetical protein [Bacilli bacterium]
MKSKDFLDLEQFIALENISKDSINILSHMFIENEFPEAVKEWKFPIELLHDEAINKYALYIKGILRLTNI